MGRFCGCCQNANVGSTNEIGELLCVLVIGWILSYSSKNKNRFTGQIYNWKQMAQTALNSSLLIMTL